MATIFRTTETNIANGTLDNLQLSLQAMQKLQNQLSSGRIINKPSDDPTGAVTAMQYRSDKARTEQYSRNATDGLGWLGTADTTLGSIVTEIQKVRDRVVQGATGTADATSRKALADEIATVKQNLVGLANTTYNNRSIFAGTADPQGQVPPLDAYDTSGNYNGNTGQVMRTIGPGAQVQVNFDGPSVFGAPGINDLWHVLDDIQTHLTSTVPVDQTKLTTAYTDPVNGAMKSDIDRLDDIRLNVQNRESEVGARYHRVETMQSRAEDNLLTIQNGLSETENVDIAKTVVALQLQNTAYQAALSATAKVIQPSLVDFLK